MPLLVLALSATKLPAVAQAPVPPPPPDPAVVAAQLANQVHRLLPEPDIRMNPDPAQSDPLVNLPTWLWLSAQSWRPVEIRSVDNAAAARAEPLHVIWETGDGTTLTCPGPGTPFDQSRRADQQQSDCSHTYRHSSSTEAGGKY
ncbi:MAG: hypothetical protein M3396_06530, partial [Actinomycetota bacterium]|nr:hypothetical protein [Actinomycetota bacterium]